MAPVGSALKSDDQFDPLVEVTGQHREMLDQVNTLFGVTPDADLDVMNVGVGASLAARTVQEMDGLLRNSRPDAVVVQGATTQPAGLRAGGHRRGDPGGPRCDSSAPIAARCSPRHGNCSTALPPTRRWPGRRTSTETATPRSGRS